MKKSTELPGTAKPEAGVEPSDANFNSTRVGDASGVPAEKKPEDVVSKGEDEEEEEENEGQDNEQEEQEEKSMPITEDDLEKSLRKLSAYAQRNDEPARKDRLLSKASSDALSKSEREELFELLGGESSKEENTITKSFEENETLQKALDVSEYLQEQHTELVKSLRNVGEEIEKSDHRRHEFNLVMAKAIQDIGLMVKSMSEQIGIVGNKPARQPKSLGVVQPSQVLHKSFGNSASSEEVLGKSQVLDALDSMMQESMSKGMQGRTEYGEDIALATSKYEQTHMISKPMLQAVKGFYQKRLSQ